MTEDINDDHEFNMALKDIDPSGCVALTGKQCRYSYAERIKRDALADNSTGIQIITDDVILYSAKPLLFKVNIVRFNVNTAQEILKQILQDFKTFYNTYTLKSDKGERILNVFDVDQLVKRIEIIQVKYLVAGI